MNIITLDVLEESTTTALTPTTFEPTSTNIGNYYYYSWDKVYIFTHYNKIIITTAHSVVDNDATTTLADTSTPSVPLPGEQGDLPNSGSGGLSGGGVAGIIIALLLLIGLGVAVVVVIVLIYKKRDQIRFKLATNADSNFSLSEFIDSKTR